MQAARDALLASELNGRGKLASFLLSGLRVGQGRCTQSIAGFNSELCSRGANPMQLEEADFCECLAEYVIENLRLLLMSQALRMAVQLLQTLLRFSQCFVLSIHGRYLIFGG